MRINKQRAERARPKAKAYELRDEAGHALRVHPGGRKTWVVRFRTVEGRQRRLRLGTFPTTGADEARREARRILRSLDVGEDPVPRRRKRSNETVADLCRWYLEEYAVEEELSPNTVRGDESRIKTHIIGRPARKSGNGARPGNPWLANKPVSHVTEDDIRQLKKAMAACPGNFRRMFQMLRVCFREAEAQGLRPRGSNPCRAKTRRCRDGIKLPKERKVERYLTTEDRARLELALQRAAARKRQTRGHTAPGYLLAIRLLAATGMRAGEAVEILRWGHVDWRHSCLHLPESKTGQKTVPLSSYALDLLRRAYDGQPPTAPVCAGQKGNQLKNLQRAWARIRADAGLPDVRLHDLRHAWASDAVMSGVPLHVVGKALGHKSPITTNRYAHIADDFLHDSVERVGQVIAEASGAEPPERVH